MIFLLNAYLGCPPYQPSTQLRIHQLSLSNPGVQNVQIGAALLCLLQNPHRNLLRVHHLSLSKTGVQLRQLEAALRFPMQILHANLLRTPRHPGGCHSPRSYVWPWKYTYACLHKVTGQFFILNSVRISPSPWRMLRRRVHSLLRVLLQQER